MQDTCQLDIDGESVTLEVRLAVDSSVQLKTYPTIPILVAIATRDGKEVWSGCLRCELSKDVPILEQFSTQELEQLYAQARNVICPNPQCGYEGRPITVSKRSRLVGLLLCLFFLLPGILYFMWMSGSGYRYYCPRCEMQVTEDS